MSWGPFRLALCTKRLLLSTQQHGSYSKARTCSAFWQSSEDGSVEVGLAGEAGSCLPASFILGELPGRGGSALQRGTRSSRHEHGAVCSPTFAWYQSSPGWQKQHARWGHFCWQRGAFPEPPQMDGGGLHLSSCLREPQGRGVHSASTTFPSEGPTTGETST